MSLVADTITPRNKGTSIKFTDSTTYLNATTKLSLDQGLVKGYCTEFDQSNNATERTFNISSVADVQTGVVDYFHANPYIGFRGYLCMHACIPDLQTKMPHQSPASRPPSQAASQPASSQPPHRRCPEMASDIYSNHLTALPYRLLLAINIYYRLTAAFMTCLGLLRPRY